MILTITLNPAVDKTACVDELVPGGLNRLDNVVISAGGKGINVSKTIKAMHKESKALGFVAGSNGEYIEHVLDELGISHEFVHVDGITRTNLKVLNKDKELTELNEIGPHITEAQIEALKDTLKANLKPDDIVVLSGSAPYGVKSDIYCELGLLAKAKGSKVILDADGDLFKAGLKAEPDVIKPNKYELCQYFGIDENIDNKVMIEYAKKWFKDGVKMVVISLGKDGAYFLNNEKVAKVKALKIKVNSSVGAGDAMVAALAYANEMNSDFETTIKEAVACSAGAVITSGTQPADYEQVNELKQQVEIEYLEGKNEN